MTPKDFDTVRDHLRSCESASLSHGYSIELVDEVERLRKFVHYVCEEVSRIGCEGPGEEICVNDERDRADWCPWCLLGEQVQIVQATAK